MYGEGKTTQNVTWQTLHIVMTTIHKLALMNAFMVATSEDKLKSRNSRFCLSVNQVTHENTHLPWRSVQLKTYGRIIKHAQSILKKTIPSPRKSKNIFLIDKHSKSKIFYTEN